MAKGKKFHRPKDENEEKIIMDNPLSGEDILVDTMFGYSEVEQVEKHYKVISVSLYKEDIRRLDDMVRELKRRGNYKINRSQLVRIALANLDVDAVPNLY